MWPSMCSRPLPVKYCLVLVTSRWWRQGGSKKFISQISRLQTTQHFRPIAGGKATYFCIDKLISIYFLTFNFKDKENYMKLYKTLLVRFNFSGNPHFIITVSVVSTLRRWCTHSTLAQLRPVQSPQWPLSTPQLCSAATLLTANVVKLLHLQFRHCFNKHNSTNLHNDLIIINR